jgi:hypothetical protein
MKNLILHKKLSIFLLLWMHMNFSNAGTWSGELLFSTPSWEYSPSAMIDLDGKTKVWRCANDGNGSDVIKYREKSPGQKWTYDVVVLWRTASWEGRHICDPSVIRGHWIFNGTSYSYAMYYTTDSQANPTNNNSIGVAFSKDGINWTKVNVGPVIYHDSSTGYGTGQQVAMSSNAGAGVHIAYTFVDSQGVPRYYFRSSTDGINFGHASAISTSGMTLNGIESISYKNPAMAIASAQIENDNFYYLVNVCETHNDSPDGNLRWGTAKSLCAYKISASQLTFGVWQKVITPYPVKPVQVEPGFLTNIYGNISSSLPNPTIYFACSGAGDPNTWEICYASGSTGNPPIFNAR